MTVYIIGMAEPSLVIDNCICDSSSQSRTGMEYVLARSAHTIENHVVANNTRDDVPGRPRGTMLKGKMAVLTSLLLLES